MHVADKSLRIEEAMEKITAIVTDRNEVYSEPLIVMLRSILDMLFAIKRSYLGDELDVMKMLVAIGQIGSQTTKAPQFWKYSK